MKDCQTPAPPTVRRSLVHTMLLPLITLAITLVTTPLQAAETTKDPKFLRQLGANYELGRGVRRNYRRAYRLYCMAAVKGDAAANYHLGWMYFNGRGIPRDTQKAAYWFKQGAIRGDQTAKNMLGLLTNTKRRKDNTCTNLSRSREADRTQIEAWAYELAPEYDLEPELVLAVIKEESNFNPKAWSPKDARGLMQLLPATARRFKVNNTWDPVDNMRGGMAYMQWLMRHFNGEVKLVLAAYNAGENAVKRHKGVPPYKETIGYVKRITKIYPKSILPTPAASPDTAEK